MGKHGLVASPDPFERMDERRPRILRGRSAPVDVLLRGNAVTYLAECDLAALAHAGVAVFYQEEDAAVRGLEGSEILDGAQPIAHSALPELLGRYDQGWHF